MSVTAMTGSEIRRTPFEAPFVLLLEGPLGSLLECLETLPDTILQLRAALLLPDLSPAQFDAVAQELAQAESLLQDAREAAERICRAVIALTAHAHRMSGT